MKAVRVRMIAAVAAFAMVAMSAVWGTAQTPPPPPPPQLVADLIDPLAHPAGHAGYGQKTDATGKITANFLGVKIGPLNKELIGKVLDVTVDQVKVGTTTVKAGAGTSGACAELKLNSANKDKVPPVKPNSTITISYEGHPPIAQGKFHPAK